MKHKLFTVLFATITMFACQKENPEQTTLPENPPCDTIDCLNGGVFQDCECDCPPGYSGYNCSIISYPSKLIITSIRINSIGNGSWDIGSNPDIYFAYGSNCNQFATNYVADASQFPITLNTNWQLMPYQLDDNFNFCMMDFDTIDSDDLMRSFQFVPADIMSGFPNQLQSNGNGFSITLYLTWEF